MMDYASLPRKRMGSGCLIFNPAGQLLLVKPNYKQGWEIPGGIVEDNESPGQCCIREVKEVVGLDVTDLELLVVDYNTYPDHKEKTESLMFIFRGGEVSEDSIVLDENDHEKFEFCDVSALDDYLTGPTLERVRLALMQAQAGKAVYSEDQKI